MAGNRHSRYSLKSSFSRDNRFFQFTPKARRPFNKMRHFYGEAMERLQEDTYNNSELPLYQLAKNEPPEAHYNYQAQAKTRADNWALICSVFITVLLTFTLLYSI